MVMVLCLHFKEKVRFPGDAFEDNKSGTVFLSFLINKTGKVSDVKILKGVHGVPSFEVEAARVVNLMPDWKPGMQNKRPVNVRLTIPVNFHLKSNF